MKVSQIDLGSEMVSVDGKETKLRHTIYRGDWERHAWYDGEGLLVLMTYEKNGAQIRLSRKAVGEVNPQTQSALTGNR